MVWLVAKPVLLTASVLPLLNDTLANAYSPLPEVVAVCPASTTAAPAKRDRVTACNTRPDTVMFVPRVSTVVRFDSAECVPASTIGASRPYTTAMEKDSRANRHLAGEEDRGFIIQKSFG